MRLTDVTLRKALESNPRLMRSLIELCIRPASNLQIQTAKYLINKCKGLKRLGDMECWKISTEELRDLNQELEKVNSKCVLTILSFPPKKENKSLIL